MLEGSVDAWNEYCEKRRVLKSKIREKRKLLHDYYMKNINESYWNKLELKTVIIYSKNDGKNTEKDNKFK